MIEATLPGGEVDVESLTEAKRAFERVLHEDSESGAGKYSGGGPPRRSEPFGFYKIVKSMGSPRNSPSPWGSLKPIVFG